MKIAFYALLVLGYALMEYQIERQQNQIYRLRVRLNETVAITAKGWCSNGVIGGPSWPMRGDGMCYAVDGQWWGDQ